MHILRWIGYVIVGFWLFSAIVFALNLAWEKFVLRIERNQDTESVRWAHRVQSFLWRWLVSGRIIIDAGGPQGAKLAKEAALFAEDFRAHRIAQYEKDRVEVLRSLQVDEWKVFSYRWNLAPPFPKGWGMPEDQMAVMHQTRLVMDQTFTEQERIFSAAWLVGHSRALPPGLDYSDGKLTGRINLPPNPNGPKLR